MNVKFVTPGERPFYRTLRRNNVRKVAESAFREHPLHPKAHLIAVLENLISEGRSTATVYCTCTSSAGWIPSVPGLRRGWPHEDD